MKVCLCVTTLYGIRTKLKTQALPYLKLTVNYVYIINNSISFYRLYYYVLDYCLLQYYYHYYYYYNNSDG